MAMVGVAEQFGNIKNYLGSVFSIYSLVDTLKKWGLKAVGKTPPVSVAEFKKYKKNTGSSKPFLVFLLFMVGMPWIVSKLISKLKTRKGFTQISPAQADFAKALHEFIPESPLELQLAKGQIVAILERTHKDWWKGRTQNGTIGYFPANRVQVIDKNVGKELTPVSSTSSIETIIPGGSLDTFTSADFTP
jgi:peroxin-13